MKKEEKEEEQQQTQQIEGKGEKLNSCSYLFCNEWLKKKTPIPNWLFHFWKNLATQLITRKKEEKKKKN